MKTVHASVRRLSFALTGALVLAGSAAFAATSGEASPEPELVELSKLVVTGEVYAFGAQKIVHVTADDLARAQANDLRDIFASDPSIQVGGGLPAAQKIYIRGLEDKLLNISIDGAPQGGYLSHHQGQYVIEPELLKSVVVEPGPGGATQGPGALAGSIRFVTRDATDFLTSGQTFGSFNKASAYSNAEGVKLTSVLYGRPAENLTALAAFTWFDTGNYEDGRGREVDHTAHTQRRGFAKLTTDILDGQQLAASVELLEDEGLYRHRPNFAGFFAHPRASNIPVPIQTTRETVTVSYAQSPNDPSRGAAATLYSSDLAIDRTGQYEMAYKSIGFDAHNRSVFDAHSLIYGLDYRDDRMSFTGKGASTGTVLPITYRTIPDEKVRVAGLYAQDQWSATPQLQVTGGVRFDHYDYTDKDRKTYEDAGVSPNLGLSYQLLDGLRLNASYGFAFRGVTVIDAITANEGSTTNAASIDPEVAGNGEIGFEYTRGAFTVAGTAYRQKIRDVIGGTSPRGNLGDLVTTGYDLSVGFRHRDFHGSVAVSEASPELNGQPLVDNDTGLGTAYGRTWNAVLGYELRPARIQFGWTIHYAEECDAAAATATPAQRALFLKPSYIVHGAYIQWLPLPDDRLVITLTAVNLFDKYYVDQATSGYNTQLARVAGLPESGRDLRLGASFRF